MSFAQLKPEIWSHIISFLAPALPKPMSGCTRQEHVYFFDEHPEHWERFPDADSPGATQRKDIRVNDLTVLMRTSITILSDSSGGSMPPPTHPHLQAKRELLSRIRYLHLEYAEKVDDPTYTAILMDKMRAKWELVGSPERLDNALHHAQQEVSELYYYLLVAVEMDRQGAKLFGKVRHLTVGAIFGGQDDIWGSMADPESGIVLDTANILRDPGDAPLPRRRIPMSEVICASARALETLFHHSTLEQYCTRSYYGPFSPTPKVGVHSATPAERQADPLPTPLYTMHLPSGASRVAAAFGSRTRWLVENHLRSMYTTNEICQNHLQQLQLFHERCADEVRGSSVPDPRTCHIEVYASSSRSTPLHASPSEQSALASVVHSKLEEEGAIVDAVMHAEKAARRRGGYGNPEGIMSWQAAPLSPPCLACGWRFEAEEK